MSTTTTKPHALTPEQEANVLKWCEALESGKYKQGEAYLRSDDGRYCCLGVARELVNKLDYCGLGGVGSALSDYGLAGELGEFGSNISTETLASLNDNGVPFWEIAAFIRHQLVTNDRNLFIRKQR